MNLNNFFVDDNQKLCFTVYDKNDKQQNQFLKEITRDDEVITYLNNITYAITDTENTTYLKGLIVKDIITNEYVGICTIDIAHYETDAISIEFAVHKKYRSSGKRYGTRILQSLVKLLEKDNYISKMVLEISNKNIASIKAAKNAGFDFDYSLKQKFIEEGYRYSPYSYLNKNYIPSNNMSNIGKR